MKRLVSRHSSLMVARIVPVTLLFLVSPALAQSGPTFDTGQQERIIRASYDRLVSYTVLSEDALSFELHDFETIYPEQFHLIDWLSVVSMPDGPLLGLHIAYKTNASIGEKRVEYELSWNDVEPDWKTTEDAPDLEGMSISEVFKMMGLEGKFEAMTSFDVTVTYGEQSRTYRAAFLWSPRDSPGETSFQVVDNITQGVSDAAIESVAPLTNPDFMQLIGDIEQPLMEKTTCSPSSNSFGQHFHDSSSWDHATGSHKANADINLNCSCSTSCYSSCSASVDNEYCTDSGLTWTWCHQIKTVSDTSSETKFGGNSKCGGAYSCNLKGCLICGLCSISVGVNVKGITVTFSNDTSADWTKNYKNTVSDCGTCATTYCGDGTCNGGETCSTCSTDCGSCACVPACPSGFFCVSGRCIG